MAALCSKDDVVLMLINEFKCDPNVRGYLGGTLLHSACCGGHVSLVKTLILEHKADINNRDEESNTPLHVAALCGKDDVVWTLLDCFEGDPDAKGHLGRSLQHIYCSRS